GTSARRPTEARIYARAIWLYARGAGGALPFLSRAVHLTCRGFLMDEDLLRRVQRLEDIEAIRLLKATYLNACDCQDSERAKGCFAAGEVLIDFGHLGVFRSRDDWEALYRAAGCQPFILDQHHGANAEIDWIDETHARASWALGYRNINTRDRTV